MRHADAASYCLWTTMFQASIQRIITEKSRELWQIILLLWDMTSTMWAAALQAPMPQLASWKTALPTRKKLFLPKKLSMPFRSIRGFGRQDQTDLLPRQLRCQRNRPGLRRLALLPAGPKNFVRIMPSTNRAIHCTNAGWKMWIPYG